MTILVDDRTKAHIPKETINILNKVIPESLYQEKMQAECEISVSFVEKEEIRQINHQFRHIDRETDVLSFPLLTFEEGEIAEKNEKGEILLGDIIISLEKAQEQAIEYGHSLHREIAFLTAHSMLHLLGYDHMTEEEEKEMFQKQKKILEKAGFPREK